MIKFLKEGALLSDIIVFYQKNLIDQRENENIWDNNFPVKIVYNYECLYS